MVALSTTDKTTNVTLSASFGVANTVGSMTSSVQGGVRADTSTAVKTYVEFWISAGSQWIVGFANSTLPLTTQLGTTKDGFGLTSGGQFRVNNGNVVSVSTPPYIGCCVRLAWDPVNKLAWVAVNGTYWNGSSTADPVAGVGGASLPVTVLNAGPWFPCFSSANNTDAVHVRFGAGDMAFPIPTGYSTMGTNIQAFQSVNKMNGMAIIRPPQAAQSVYKELGYSIISAPQTAVSVYKMVGYAILRPRENNAPSRSRAAAYLRF